MLRSTIVAPAGTSAMRDALQPPYVVGRPVAERSTAVRAMYPSTDGEPPVSGGLAKYATLRTSGSVVGTGAAGSYPPASAAPAFSNRAISFRARGLLSEVAKRFTKPGLINSGSTPGVFASPSA
jgi:hypothetical protein